MTGKTHRLGGTMCCLLGFSILQQKGMLINEVNPMLQLTVMYPFSVYGSIVSDLDHHWNSCPAKDMVSLVINKLLHLATPLRDSVGKLFPPIRVFDAKHRSWQTHSDLFLVCMCWLLWWLLGQTGTADALILSMVGTGFILGIISHLLLDMITPEGVWSIVFVVLNKIFHLKLPDKIHFVPKKEFFATGGPWETLIGFVLRGISFVLLLRIVYILNPFM